MYFLPAIAKDCGPLQIPINGSVLGLYLTTFPNSLTFACDPGFILKGSRVRHCEANAVWSGNKTFCQGKTTPKTSKKKKALNSIISGKAATLSCSLCEIYVDQDL